ncbi:MAG: hypothetical protein MK141_14080 [Pseudoxanthomonas sp.]|uniref:hypothetical protein n=1 Tax=Pseudoxanthomonas sp. TaxID=1871049 RepID=UPI00258FF00F|nr:hypothetical protein [Pseudoxanthomonas sp.]MCH2092687.1 hypothetical protein [Pseudoxanthomonas sp.]
MSARSQAIHAPTGMPMKEHSASVLNAAMCIADDAVRSDIECYARRIQHPEGFDCYDLNHAEVSGIMDEAEKAHAVATAQRAARYIELRGDAFPWRLVKVDGSKRLVRFVDKEQQS